MLSASVDIICAAVLPVLHLMMNLNLMMNLSNHGMTRVLHTASIAFWFNTVRVVVCSRWK